jgi:hypothetical protein
MREHLENTAPIVRELDPAPATKRAMLRQEAARRLPTEALTTPANAGESSCPFLAFSPQTRLV